MVSEVFYNNVMIKKYQKPVARNLGEISSTADGYCSTGSLANGSGPTNCLPGGQASGGCGNGIIGFFSTACNSGLTPSPYCHTGLIG